MALITCTECGKEFSDKAVACPNCGCPTDEILSSEPVEKNASAPEDFDDETSVSVEPESIGSRAIEAWKERTHATSKVGPVSIDQGHKKFQIHGVVQKKKSGIIGKSMKGMLAFSTMGMSVLAEKAIGQGGSVNKWFDFNQLISYDLLEDDSVVTSGGVGQALVGGALFGAAGAIAGGITGKRTSRKKVESIMIKATLNDFDVPCIMVPITTKSIKVGSKDYQSAMTSAHSILSALDVIAHNR